MFLVINFDRIMCLDIWISAGENMEERDLFMTDEDIHCLDEPTPEEIEIEKLKEENNGMRYKLEDIRIVIDKMYKQAAKALKEEIAPSVKKYLEYDIRDIRELLEILSDD